MMNRLKIFLLLIVAVVPIIDAVAQNVYDGLEVKTYRHSLNALPMQYSAGCDSVYVEKYGEAWYFNVDTLCYCMATDRHSVRTENLAHYYYFEVMDHASEAQIASGYAKMKAAAEKYRAPWLNYEAEYMQVHTSFYSKHIGQGNADASDVEQAVQCLHNLMKRLEPDDEKILKLRLLRDSYDIYRDVGNYAKMFKCIPPIIELLDKITPDDYIEYHYVLYFIGSDYLRFGDVQRAIPYLHRALHPKPSYFADRSDLRARLSLANYYAGINQLDSADYYYRSLYDDTTTVRFRPSFDVHAAVGITNNMLKREQFAEALPLALRWLQPAQRDRMESAILNLYINIGECYLADNKHAMALAMCDSVQMLVDKNPKLRNSRYYNFMFDCYLKTGDNTKAQQYADSMQRAATNNAKQTGSLVILRAEQELFETEKALHEQQISGYRTRIFIVTLILALIVAASIVILLLYRQKWAAYRALVAHIKQLQSEQDVKTRTLLQKTTFRNAQTSNSSFCPDSRQDKLYLKIRDLLLKDKIHRDPYLSRDLLVKRLGINRYNLEDAFLFCFGMQYAEYINLLRINDAITLLEQSDLSIEEIAEKAGFGSVRTFQRQFQIKYNISPKDYRKMTKKEEKTA